MSNGRADEVAVSMPETRELEDVHLEWLSGRGISASTAEGCGLVAGDVYLGSRGAVASCVGFPYQNHDGTESIKWRDSGKAFSQSGSAASLWRIDEFVDGDLIICEGEIDALSYEEVSLDEDFNFFATSVPNGAPSKLSESTEGTKYSYLWEGRDYLARADRVFIATDADDPGNILAEEIVRRVGKGKCWRVSYPAGCKDANDVLAKFGGEALKKTLVDAMPWPVVGIRDATEYRGRAISLYVDGMDGGVSLGIGNLDAIFRVNPQTLTVFTGIPGSGKSAFLTYASVILASRSGWKSVVMSAETPPEIHVLQMASVYLRKPFRGPNRMSERELSLGLDWVQEHFTFLDEADSSIDSVLERAQISIMRHGSRIVQIDPFNFIAAGSDMDDSVSKINACLVSLKRFARDHDVVVWLVAHPTKMHRMPDGRTPKVSGYDVAGSAAFYGVSDVGVTVSREDFGQSKVSVWKARFPWCGRIGEADLMFDCDTGVFGLPTFGGGVKGGKGKEGEKNFNFDDF